MHCMSKTNFDLIDQTPIKQNCTCKHIIYSYDLYKCSKYIYKYLPKTKKERTNSSLIVDDVIIFCSFHKMSQLTIVILDLPKTILFSRISVKYNSFSQYLVWPINSNLMAQVVICNMLLNVKIAGLGGLRAILNILKRGHIYFVTSILRQCPDIFN